MTRPGVALKNYPPVRGIGGVRKGDGISIDVRNGKPSHIMRRGVVVIQSHAWEGKDFKFS